MSTTTVRREYWEANGGRPAEDSGGSKPHRANKERTVIVDGYQVSSFTAALRTNSLAVHRSLLPRSPTTAVLCYVVVVLQVLKVNNYQMQEGGISAWDEAAGKVLQQDGWVDATHCCG